MLVDFMTLLPATPLPPIQEGATDKDYLKQHALEQFTTRKKTAITIDNGQLVAGEPMYYCCKHCNTICDVVAEDFLFPPRTTCSQCAGLEKQGWLEEAKAKCNE